MLKKISFLFLFAFIFVSCKDDKVVAPAKSGAKAITKFRFTQFNPAIEAIINETTKHITAIVPANADLTKLKASVVISNKATISPDTATLRNFSTDVIYTVTAEDGTKAEYKVMVSKTKFTGKDIISFTFADLSPAVTATIDPATKKITANVPANTDITKLKPTITLSDRATVSPTSASVVDFTNAVNFTVTAEDGTKAEYKVMVNKTKFTGKDIISFTFADLSPAVTATIDPATKKITANVPASTDITKLKPTITLSDKATVTPASATVVDFTNAVNFTVKAENGDLQVYSVVVKKAEVVIPNNNANKTVYITSSKGKIYAINATTGVKNWEYQMTGMALSASCSPTFANDIVFCNNSNGTLYALNANNGALIWKTSDGSRSLGSKPVSPIYFNGVIYSGGNGLIALKASDGSVIWKNNASCNSNPTIYNGNIYFSDGYEIASANLNTGVLGATYKPFGGGISAGNPTIVNGKIYHTAYGSGYAMDIASNKIIFELNIGNDTNQGSSIFYEDKIIYSGYDKLLAVNPITGTTVWKVDGAFSNLFFSPIASSKLVYAFANSKLNAYNTDNGNLVWQYTPQGTITSPCVANGIIYTGSTSETVIAVDGKTGKEIWKFNAGSEVYSAACVVDNTDKIYYSAESGLTN